MPRSHGIITAAALLLASESTGLIQQQSWQQQRGAAPADSPVQSVSGGRSGGVVQGRAATSALRGVTLSETDAVDACGVSYEMNERMRTTRFLHPTKVDVVQAMEPFVQLQIDKLLLTPETSWQPSDFLPDLTQDDWVDQVREFRKDASGISDDLLVVLIGDMVTEEALPTYQTLLNTFEGTDDPTGVSDSPWAVWSRTWTSEENRHGDLLNKYLYLTGKCDMRAVEGTIQRLIANGFNAGATKDPYRGFVYTSFQERATKISHGNVGKLAAKEGDPHLARICAAIAGDEARHEKAYQAFVREILAADPEGGLLAFRDMMRTGITMPAQLMDDGTEHMRASRPNGDSALFASFSTSAQRLGVYTALDYAEIIDHLVRYWDIGSIGGLEGEAAEAQEFLCKLPPRYQKLAERSMDKQSKKPAATPVEYSWLHNRAV